MASSRTAPDHYALVPVFPLLETPRLHLVEITRGHAAWYLAHFSSPEIVEGSGFPAPAGLGGAREELERFITGPFEQRTGLRWGMVPIAAPESMIGSIGYYQWRDEPEPAAVLGYDLEPEWWGRGLMSEAAEAVVDYGFDQMRLAFVEATVLVGNDRSCRTLERTGFVRAGVLPLHGQDEHGNRRDEYHYIRRAPGRTVQGG